mmetsp:Transcript_6415/g.11155  ORF Transcript_6415/g.11155 Transcript_6415/m.11155 type:complete len:415 (-) Transcript_6415:183-1427(-)
MTRSESRQEQKPLAEGMAGLRVNNTFLEVTEDPAQDLSKEPCQRAARRGKTAPPPLFAAGQEEGLPLIRSKPPRVSFMDDGDEVEECQAEAGCWPGEAESPVQTPTVLHGNAVPWVLETPAHTPTSPVMPRLADGDDGDDTPRPKVGKKQELQWPAPYRLPVDIESCCGNVLKRMLTAVEQSMQDACMAPKSQPSLSRQQLQEACAPFLEQMVNLVFEGCEDQMQRRLSSSASHTTANTGSSSQDLSGTSSLELCSTDTTLPTYASVTTRPLQETSPQPARPAEKQDPLRLAVPLMISREFVNSPQESAAEDEAEDYTSSMELQGGGSMELMGHMKSAMVCRHWKSKGWCKLGENCKFQHPDHKRGVGQTRKRGGAAHRAAERRNCTLALDTSIPVTVPTGMPLWVQPEVSSTD